MLHTLQAKVTPPRLPDSLLNQWAHHTLFDKADHGELLLVCAPAGCGKTTFASAYLRASPRASCWYSLDETDNDTLTFGRHMIASFMRHLPLSDGLCRKAESGAYQDLNELLRELLIELEGTSEPVRLVLDDVHRLTHPAILAALELFLAYFPRPWQIVLTSRTEPQTLQRLCSQRATLRVSAQDLQFGEAAVIELFGSYGHRISAAAAQRLNERVAGWVTGLKLIALNYRATVAVETMTAALQGGEIHHYLFHEIYRQLDEPLRRFLTTTSVCERFNRELAETLTGLRNIDPFLQEIDRRQFFMSRFGDEGAWFRYHPLLADFLRAQLADGQEVRRLHGLAAAWWQSQDHVHIAARHHAASGEIEGLTSFLLSQGETLFNSGHTQALSSCLAALPAEAVAADLHLTSMYAWLEHVVKRRPERVLPLVQAAERALMRSDPPARARARTVAELGSVSAAVCLDAGEVERARELAQAALRQWDGQPSIKCAPIHSVLSDIAVQDGDLRTAQEHSRRAAALDHAHGYDLGMFWHLHQQAEHAYLAGDLHGAERLLDGAMTLATTRRLGYLPRYDSWLRSKARLLWQRLQWQEAERHLERSMSHTAEWVHEQTLDQIGLCRIAIARRDHVRAAALHAQLEAAWLTVRHPPRTQHELGSVLVQLWADRGDMTMLERFVGLAGVEGWASNPQLQQATRSVALAFLALGQPGQASAVLTPALEAAAGTGLLTDYHHAATIQAAALWRQGFEQPAARLLETTLQWVEQQNAYMTVLAQAGYVEPVLGGLAPRHRSARRLLQWIRQDSHQLRRAPARTLPDAARAYGLTRQEWRLLKLIGEGLSNDRICDQLHVAMNTVRSHIRSINKKLDVSTRDEAIRVYLRLQSSAAD